MTKVKDQLLEKVKDRRESKERKRQFKKNWENFYKKDKKRMVRDSKYAKDAMLNNPFKEDVDPKKFPGFDQAGRIRAGLKKGGGAGQTTREKEKFQLDKNINKIKKQMKGPRLTTSQEDTLRDRMKQPLKRKKHNIGGRANLLEEMGRIDARRHPDAADRAEKRRVIGELNRGYKSGGAVLKGKKVGCQIK